MSFEKKIEEWKRKCTKEAVIKWFIDKDHFRVGLDNGGTSNKIMDDLGFKNPDEDRLLETYAKYHFRACMNMVRKYFKNNGFILSSKKFGYGKKTTPTVYYLIDNLSEERTNRHYKMKYKTEISIFNFRNDKMDLLQLQDKVKDEKVKELFKKAYALRIDVNPTMIKRPGRIGIKAPIPNHFISDGNKKVSLRKVMENGK